MSIFTSPPRTTKHSFRRGDVHLGVWALQRFLNVVYAGKMPFLAEDGVFGRDTDTAVKKYQADVGAYPDGVVGPITQSRIVRSCVVRAPSGPSLPVGLVEGIIDGESSRLIAAVNANGTGGIDLGLTQRRVYGPPFDTAKVKAAMNPLSNVAYSVMNVDKTGVYDRYKVYSSRLGTGEYAWRVATLAHNWPWAATELSYGRRLSATKLATWAQRPDGSWPKFADGAPVKTYADWARFYAIGSHAHRHRGLVTKLAFGVPSYDR
jgi:peptidoglycan hydrolase-like protein with peptidoglycan-binding domain